MILAVVQGVIMNGPNGAASKTGSKDKQYKSWYVISMGGHFFWKKDLDNNLIIENKNKN